MAFALTGRVQLCWKDVVGEIHNWRKMSHQSFLPRGKSQGGLKVFALTCLLTAAGGPLMSQSVRDKWLLAGDCA